MFREFYFTSNLSIVEKITVNDAPSTSLCSSCCFRLIDGTCNIDKSLTKPNQCGSECKFIAADTTKDSYFNEQAIYNGHIIKAVESVGCGVGCSNSCVFLGRSQCFSDMTKYDIDTCSCRRFVTVSGTPYWLIDSDEKTKESVNNAATITEDLIENKQPADSTIRLHNIDPYIITATPRLPAIHTMFELGVQTPVVKSDIVFLEELKFEL